MRLALWDPVGQRCQECGTQMSRASHCRACGRTLCSECCPLRLRVWWSASSAAVKSCCGSRCIQRLQEEPGAHEDASERLSDSQLRRLATEVPRCSSREALWPLLRLGVPCVMRPAVYSELLGCYMEKKPPAARQLQQEELHMLEADLQRSVEEEQTRAQVRAILETALGQRRDLSYQQGFCFIALAFRSLVGDGDLAAACLRMMCCNACYGLSSPGQWVDRFERILEQQLPQLFRHFGAHQVDTNLYVTTWFKTAFAEFLVGDPILGRIWDLYVCYGLDFLYRVSLALLRRHRKELLKLRSTQLLLALVRLPERAKGTDPDTFIKELL